MATVALDWIFDHSEERWVHFAFCFLNIIMIALRKIEFSANFLKENMSDLFRQGIDQFIDFELGLYEVQSEGKGKELTKELALSMYVVVVLV